MPVIHQNYALKELNSFGVEAQSSLYARPSSLEELVDILGKYDYQKLPFLVMGEGSNILFTRDFEGLIISPDFKGIDLLEEGESDVLVKVGAGENWDHWVETATAKGWFGLENLSLIPGSVGSSPVQNIGAYGVELKDHFEWLEAWDLQENKLVKMDRKSCQFAYRSSVFKFSARGRFIITAVCFRLSKSPSLTLNYGHIGNAFKAAGGSSAMDLRKVVIQMREQKLPDPAKNGNAGSFFKNPVVDRTLFKCIRVDYNDIPYYPEVNNSVKIPAAWLIENSGWKGKRVGKVGTWPKQPLVIVNHGGASGTEILQFSEMIAKDVEDKFSISLEREVNVF